MGAELSARRKLDVAAEDPLLQALPGARTTQAGPRRRGQCFILSPNVGRLELLGRHSCRSHSLCPLPAVRSWIHLFEASTQSLHRQCIMVSSPNHRNYLVKLHSVCRHARSSVPQLGEFLVRDWILHISCSAPHINLHILLLQSPPLPAHHYSQEFVLVIHNQQLMLDTLVYQCHRTTTRYRGESELVPSSSCCDPVFSTVQLPLDVL